MRRCATSTVRRRASVGWGREHRADLHALHQRTDLALAAPRGDRRLQALVEWTLAGCALASREDAQAVLLLDQVGEQEVDGECPRQCHCGVRRQTRDVGKARCFVPPPASIDRARADALDQLEELGALLLDDDLAEQRTEQLDLAGQRFSAAPARPGCCRSSGGHGRRGVSLLRRGSPHCGSALARRTRRCSRGRRGLRAR
jgi:hypothetical protein